jgi:hypothetical protein
MKTDPLNGRTTAMATLQITDVSTDVRNFGGPTPTGTGLPSVTVTLGKEHKLTVMGNGPDGVVCCTLVRLGRKDKDEKSNETISRTTRFAKSSATGGWTVNFEVKHLATYLVACHSGAENDYANVVANQTQNSDSFKKFLSMDPTSFTSAKITAIGTVFYANNPVTCTLTPIALDGTNKSGAPASSQTATATFTDSSDWKVSFAPLPPDTTYSGSYLLEATAANEGTVSATGDV